MVRCTSCNRRKPLPIQGQSGSQDSRIDTGKVDGGTSGNTACPECGRTRLFIAAPAPARPQMTPAILFTLVVFVVGQYFLDQTRIGKAFDRITDTITRYLLDFMLISVLIPLIWFLVFYGLSLVLSSPYDRALRVLLQRIARTTLTWFKRWVRLMLRIRGERGNDWVCAWQTERGKG